jgi:hypothetical protein
MSAHTIAQEWDRFESSVIAADAPTIQRDEMRIAFYAGFKSMLDLNKVLGAMPETPAIEALKALAYESREFGVTLGGRAREDIDDDS